MAIHLIDGYADRFEDKRVLRCERERQMINRAMRKQGHGYVQGRVNAYCPKCSSEAWEREGRLITVLTCEYDDDEGDDD